MRAGRRSRPRGAPRDLGWLRRRRRGARPRPRRSAGEVDDDSDPSPTVAYGDPVPEPNGHPPHEAPGIMVLPVMVLAFLAAVGGILNLPFTSMEWLEQVPRAVVPRRARREARQLRPGLRPRDAHLRHRGVRHLLRLQALQEGPRARRPRPARREARRARPHARQRLLLRPRHLEAGGRSRAGPPPRGSTGSSTPRSSTAPSTASADFFELLSRGVQEIQDGHVRRYAMGIAIGTVGILLYVVLWIGR